MDQENEILQFLRDAAVEYLEIDSDRIQMTTSFDELDIDSLDVIELCKAVEDEFNVELPDDTIKTLQTVRDLVYAIAKLRRLDDHL